MKTLLVYHYEGNSLAYVLVMRYLVQRFVSL